MAPMESVTESALAMDTKPDAPARFYYTRKMENFMGKLSGYFYQKIKESFAKSVREMKKISLSLGLPL
jgi:hypothetical protein